LKQTLALAVPIMAGQLGQMLMGVADTVMISRTGTVPLAAAALGNTLTSILMVSGIGLLAAVAVQVSHAHGARDAAAAGQSLRHGLWISLGLGLLVLILGAAGWLLLPVLRQDPAVIQALGPYLAAVLPSLVFVFGATALKNFSEGQSSPWVPFWVTLGGVVLNVALNWVLIFGHAGFPALGLLGAGIATLLSRIAIWSGLQLYVARSRRFNASRPKTWLGRPCPRQTLAQVRLGLPVSAQLLVEVGAFGAASLLIGSLGPVPLAAHQVAITVAATLFMLPLGLGMATTVRVGQLAGGGEFERVRRTGFGALAAVATFMAASALFLLLAAPAIARLFTPDLDVVRLAVPLLIIAGFFQLFDGIQVVSIGALRGLKDVQVPAGIAFCAYWLAALPLGWLLGFPGGLGATGVWIGLALGLAAAAAGLTLRFWKKSAQAGACQNPALPALSPTQSGRGEMADAQA
jgi:MATE family multidrug resistance protein